MVNDGEADSNIATVSISVNSRVNQGLVVYYLFTAGSGTMIYDQSGTGTPMDLMISGSVAW